MKTKSKCTISPIQMRLNTPKRYCYCSSPLAGHLLCAMPPGGHLITRSSIAEINFPVVESMVFGETTPLRTARAGSEPVLSASRLRAGSEPVLSASRLSAPFRWAGGEAIKG